jgi:hypothetical protein
VNVNSGQRDQLGQGLGGKVKTPAFIAPEGLKIKLLQTQTKTHQGKEQNPMA